MELKLITDTYTENSTVGKLYIDGVFECNTLEDKNRELTSEMPFAQISSVKVMGRTAIPYGKFHVSITFSNRFQKLMPLVENVPGFAGIRIHSGNTDKDTEGCILVGKYQENTPDIILHSRDAFSKLFSKIQGAIDRKETVTLTKEKSV